MVFRPPPHEVIESLRAMLSKLEQDGDTESADLVYLKRIMVERIAELEAVQAGESLKAETFTTHRHAA
jgi:hypothetical protein